MLHQPRYNFTDFFVYTLVLLFRLWRLYRAYVLHVFGFSIPSWCIRLMVYVCECVWSFSYGTRLSLLVLNIFSFLCVFWFFFSHLILLLLLVPLWPLSLPLPCRCNTWLRKWSLLRNIQHIVQMREIFFAMVLCLILFFFHTTSKRRICFIQQHKTPIGTMHYVYRTY